MDQPACRLFVIPARDVPIAVVFRRGPTEWYHVILWELTSDHFEHGAWFRGRIYEDKCDLSPDGKLLVTMIMQGNRGRTSYTSAWTAVSRAPWLHALTLWPLGSTWGGGGRFEEKRKLVIRLGALFPTHPRHPISGIEVVPGSPTLHRSAETVDGADWAGRGRDGRLIFSRGGKLIRREGEREVEVADFNGLKPAPSRAPAWAREPLRDVSVGR